ncbi:hypothetical protein PROH_09395 [Prochlorothrix hollandica PCC 9006 = CALU 1027]|uniref:Guanylate cyclase domain-containing protein n=1 Tax=Prochlorothrix hollandica PCC 9006 = CALU 1027 TaxID=317619 RepID=A0A0M2PWH8_PROHO|nr:hypothetical protein PROH_09395 [Prochlorothrix hollandica PCC 9006 = CALU 1027]
MIAPWRTLPHRFNNLPLPLLGGVLAGAIVVLDGLGTWRMLEWQGYRITHNLREGLGLEQPWDDRLAVIAIDEKSIQAYGQFNTWSRNYYTQLLQTLEASPPIAIGFDILLSESTPDDPALAEAMWINGSTVLAVAADDKGHSFNPTSFLDSAAALGHVLHRSDSDGLTRHLWLYIPSSPVPRSPVPSSPVPSSPVPDAGQAVPHLSLALAEVYNLYQSTTLDLPEDAADPPPSSPGTIAIPPPQPTLAANEVLIHWPTLPSKLPTYSLVDVLDGDIAPEIFQNKIVLLGITALGFDPLQTPFYKEPLTTGVYLHGVALHNLLQDSFLRRVPFPLQALGLILLGSISAPLLKRGGIKEQVAVLTLVPLGWLGVAVVGLGASWWLPLVTPMATLLTVTLGVQLKERQEKRMLMYLFSQHVAPEMAQLIWDRRSEIFDGGELQAQELEATVLFMDIRNFTTISEGSQPTQLLRWLNRYLEAMTDCIMNQGGVVDKYIGDAIMAVFGIPVPRQNQDEVRQDACNAITASLAMHRRLQLLNQEFAQEGLPLVRFGIGIHTGRLVAGTVGSSRRLNYSVLGDTVNVAARIEALNKNQQEDNPFDLLISGRTFAYVRDRYDAKQLNAIKLKGKATATLIYAIQGERQGDGGEQKPRPVSPLRSLT